MSLSDCAFLIDSVLIKIIMFCKECYIKKGNVTNCFWQLYLKKILFGVILPFLVIICLPVSCEVGTPLNLPPVVEVGNAVEISRNSATIEGAVSVNGKGQISKLVFKYGSSPDSINKTIVCNPAELNPVVKLDNLKPGTTYYYLLEAGNETYTVLSDTKNFETIPNQPPVISNVNVIYNGLLSGTFSCLITDNGGEPVKETGLYCWKQISSNNISEGSDNAVRVLSHSSDMGIFYTKLTNLEVESSYCVQAFATSSVGEGLSNIVVFTTGAPQVKLEKAGTLAEVIEESEVVNLKKLSICGNMNGSDYAFLRAILGGNPNHNVGNSSHHKGVLNFIDLSETNIVEGGSTYDGYRYTVKDVVSAGLFEGCVNLKEISLPKSASTLETDAFNGCTNLEKLIITENISSISQSVGCDSLKEIECIESNPYYSTKDGVLFSKNMKELVWWPLAKPFSKTFEWPKSLEKIREYAFREYSGDSINLPVTLKDIGAYAFAGSSLESIELPEEISVLPKGVFQNSLNLKSVTAGSKIGYISDYSFGGCPLHSVYIKADTFIPYVSSNAFYGVDIKNCTLYIKKGAKSLYKSNAFWSMFGNIVEVE